MSLTNPLNAVFGNQKFKELADVDFRSYAGLAGDLIVVNNTETGLNATPSSSFIPPVIGTGAINDVPIFTGGVPIFDDSGLQITNISTNIILEPSDNLNSLNLISQQGVNVNGVFGINLDATAASISSQCDTFGVVSYNAIQLNANNSVTIQCGPNQIVLSPTSLEINCGSGVGLVISNNNSGDQWKFSTSATGGVFNMPSTGGLNGSVLTNDGLGNLSWNGGA
jgi:hypothetical protein